MSTKPNKEKRILKTEPKLKIELSDEQKEVVKLFHEFDVIFINGDFGTGKTATAVHIALSAFRKKMFNKIWITRPMLKNQLAALPGTLEEKLHPYIYPILQNMEMCQGKELTEKMKKDGNVEIIPFDVAKGLTFSDSVVIVDEWQDIDYQDFRTILTRLGKDSKMIFCGSKEQIDRTMLDKTCYHRVSKLENSGIVGWADLKANHRNEILMKIINYLEKND